MPSGAALKRAAQAAVALGGLAAAWQIASYFFPAALFPPVPAIGRRFMDILFSGEELVEVLMTAGRIFSGLAGAFALGVVLAVLISRSRTLENYLTPLLTFLQGIPALSWVVIAIIWFHGVEFRVFFIMVMTTLPAFTYQILDAIRSISTELHDMVLSFRPTRRMLFRVLVVPAVIPGILTAWRVNLGNASRVVVVAELVGATGGVGYELLRQQQLFDMAGALAWTLQLVVFVLVVQQIINALENWLLRYRSESERAA
jgi:ABC-type nitrate/sulfonate/bicarbonate transport system permease component